MTDDRMQLLRERLQQELKETQARIAQLRERLETKADYGPGRGDPAIYEWELNLARLERAELQLEQIRSALTRLETGTYGLCQQCNHRIDDERLELLPLTPYCIRCAQLSHGGRG